MAFANEIRDFINTFNAGSQIVERIKSRQNAEERQRYLEESDADRRATQKEQYASTMEFNRKKQQDWNDAQARREQYNRDVLAENTRRAKVSEAGAEETRQAARRKEQRDITASDLKQRQDDFDAATKAYYDQLNKNPALEGDPSFRPPTRADYGLPTYGAGAGIPAGVGAGNGPRVPTAGIPVGGDGTSSPDSAAASGEPSPQEPPPSDVQDPGVVGGGAFQDLGITRADVNDAIKGGLTHLQDYYLGGQGVQAGAQNEAGKAALIAGNEGATNEENDMISQALDHMDRNNGIDTSALGDDLKNIRNMVRARQVLLSRGGTDNTAKANALAADIIQLSRHRAAILGANAEVKFKKGDIAGGVEDLKEGYKWVPNAQSVDFDPQTGRFTVTDDTNGKVINEGTATPEDLVAAASGLRDGSLYYRELLQAAKMKDDSAPEEIKLPQRDRKASQVSVDPFATTAAVGGEGGASASPEEDTGGNGSPITPLGKQTIEESIQQTLTSSPVLGGVTWDEIQAKMKPERVQSLQDLARQITEYNNVPPERAAQIAISLADPDPTQASQGDRKWNFKLLRGSNEKAMGLKAEDGTVVILPTGLATPQLVNASEGLRDLAIGRSQQRVDAGAAQTRQDIQHLSDQRTTERERDIARQKEISEDRGPQALPPGESGAGIALERATQGIKATSGLGKQRTEPRVVTEPKGEPGVNRLKSGLPGASKPAKTKVHKKDLEVEEPASGTGSDAFREKMKKLRKQ